MYRMFDRSYAVVRLNSTNLLLVLVDSTNKCSGECRDVTRLLFRPVEDILCTCASVILANLISLHHKRLIVHSKLESTQRVQTSEAAYA